MAAASRISHTDASCDAQLGVDFVHLAPDKPSSRAPEASIKPHGPHRQGADMHKELEAYPKCS